MYLPHNDFYYLLTCVRYSEMVSSIRLFADTLSSGLRSGAVRRMMSRRFFFLFFPLSCFVAVAGSPCLDKVPRGSTSLAAAGSAQLHLDRD